MHLSTLFFILISCLIVVVKSIEFQIPIRQPVNNKVPVQNDEHYSTAQQWVLAETQAMSCAKCISLLQMLKNVAHFSESMFIAAGMRICRRIGQVDTDVVRNFFFPSFYSCLSVILLLLLFFNFLYLFLC